MAGDSRHVRVGDLRQVRNYAGQNENEPEPADTGGVIYVVIDIVGYPGGKEDVIVLYSRSEMIYTYVWNPIDVACDRLISSGTL